jgi:hypothetical protein
MHIGTIIDTTRQATLIAILWWNSGFRAPCLALLKRLLDTLHEEHHIGPEHFSSVPRDTIVTGRSAEVFAEFTALLKKFGIKQ